MCSNPGTGYVYCWIDLREIEAEHNREILRHHGLLSDYSRYFKIGRSSNVQKRLSDERKETSNLGEIHVIWILKVDDSVQAETHLKRYLRPLSKDTGISTGKEWFFCKILTVEQAMEIIGGGTIIDYDEIRESIIEKQIKEVKKGELTDLKLYTHDSVDHAPSDNYRNRCNRPMFKKGISVSEFLNTKGKSCKINKQHSFIYSKNGKIINYKLCDLWWDIRCGYLVIK